MTPKQIAEHANRLITTEVAQARNVLERYRARQLLMNNASLMLDICRDHIQSYITGFGSLLTSFDQTEAAASVIAEGSRACAQLSVLTGSLLADERSNTYGYGFHAPKATASATCTNAMDTSASASKLPDKP